MTTRIKRTGKIAIGKVQRGFIFLLTPFNLSYEVKTSRKGRIRHFSLHIYLKINIYFTRLRITYDSLLLPRKKYFFFTFFTMRLLILLNSASEHDLTLNTKFVHVITGRENKKQRMLESGIISRAVIIFICDKRNWSYGKADGRNGKVNLRSSYILPRVISALLS